MERPGGSRGSRSASAAQVTMELRRRPISTLKVKKKKKLLRRKIIPSITERQAEKCLKCFSFSCLFFFLKDPALVYCKSGQMGF